MKQIELGSELLNYLAQAPLQPGDRLPTIHELSSAGQLGISISKFREQLSIARALGLVDVRTRNGMQLREYDFKPAVMLSLLYALAREEGNFELFAELRVQLELAFWDEACARLHGGHFAEMRDCLAAAQAMLQRQPIRIPFREHREFHMTMFRDLENHFVTGLLSAYWDAYELVQRHRYRDYDYLRRVWDYHERMLAALERGDAAVARQHFQAHTRLLHIPPWRMGESTQAQENGEYGENSADLSAERS